MKVTLFLIAIALAVCPTAHGQDQRSGMKEELLQAEKDFGAAIVRNDADAIGQFLANDWVIIDPDGGIVDKARFLGVIKSGTLTHEKMDSEEVTVRVYGNTGVVTALTTSKGKYAGQDFTTRERSSDVFVKQDGHWRCVFSQLTSVKSKS